MLIAAAPFTNAAALLVLAIVINRALASIDRRVTRIEKNVRPSTAIHNSFDFGPGRK